MTDERSRRRLSLPGREKWAELSRRTRQVLLLAGVTGVVTGALVAGFEWITAEVLLARVDTAPLALQALLPAVGLALAVGLLRSVGRGASPTTADEFIQAFHDPGGRLAFPPVPARIAAAIATLGLGGPLGYEGPSLYGGAAIGSALQRRWSRLFGPEDSKVLLVAGAAAGVAAIFKAPVTGLVFALEVPYQDDLARRMLLPAAISAAASYVVFAAVSGTEPILPVAGQPPFNLVDLGGAAVIGLVCGVLARAFIALIVRAKDLSTRVHPFVRIIAAGTLIAATVVIANGFARSDFVIGPGYDALEWALRPDRAVAVVVGLATLRVVGTVAVVGGGGVGGLFIPLVIQGALVGRAVGGLFEAQTTTLFPVIGMAAFLGAGYRVPLAAVVFVAEFTGRPGFVVPGLIAAVVAQLVMGRASVSPYQLGRRGGHLERRLRMPLAAVTDIASATVDPTVTIDEAFWRHFVRDNQYSAPVVDGDAYLGMVIAEDLARVDRAAWYEVAVTELMRTDLPVARPDWSLGDAIRVMDGAGVDRIAVCDGGRFAGVVSKDALVQLDELLDGDL